MGTRKSARIMLFAACGLLAACAPNNVDNPRTEIDARDSKLYWVGDGYMVREFRLTDGTRCVHAGVGGITCDWARSPPEQPRPVVWPEAAQAMILPDGSAAWVK